MLAVFIFVYCRLCLQYLYLYIIDYVGSMWEFILPSLLKAIESEPEKDIQAEVMSSLAQVIHISLLLIDFNSQTMIGYS